MTWLPTSTTNIDNVSASLRFNTVVAKTVGTGIVRENQVAIQIGAIGASRRRLVPASEAGHVSAF